MVCPGATHPAGDYLLSTTAADSKTYTYDANGNLTSDRVRTFLWDADGAREREDGAPGSGVPGAKQRVSKAGAPGATDEQNRLISIIEASKKSKFSYDGLGRRVRIRELDRGTETSNRTFVWSGTAIVEERNAAGTQASKRYYARGLVDRTGSEDKKYYYTFDHLGSTREVVEDDGVTVAARYDYDPFGRVEKLGGTYEADFLYTGHFYHQPSGLYLTHYRAYDPETGVWLSRDPLGYVDGPNPYTYVSNNPIRIVDPFGLVDLNLIDQNKEPVNYQIQDNIQSQPGEYTVGGHGDATRVEDQTANGMLNAKKLANKILKDPNYKKGTPVKLYACSTGKNQNAIAQDLATELGVPVTAPNDILWMDTQGTEIIAPRDPQNPSQPDSSNPGQWVTFQP